MHSTFVSALHSKIGFVIANTPVLILSIKFLDPSLTVEDVIVPVKFATGMSAFVFVRPVSPLNILKVASSTVTLVSAIEVSVEVLDILKL